MSTDPQVFFETVPQQQEQDISYPTYEQVNNDGVQDDQQDSFPTLPASQPHQVQNPVVDSDEPTFIFSVSEPEKVSTGKTFELSYWMYKITVDTKLDQYKQPTLICHRRYNDFVWFRELLVSNYTGIVIPPLPEKSILASVEKIFSSVDTNSLLEYRQRALTKFLTRVGEHPVLQTSMELQQFLESSEEEFNVLKNTKTKSSKSGGSSFSLFKTKSATPEPEWITNHRKFIDKLESALKELRQKLQTMITRRKEMASAFLEYGKAFMTVGNIEKEYDSANSLAKNLLDVGQSAEQLSKVTDDQAQKETMQVIETLTYYLGMCESIKHTVSQVEDLRNEKDSAQAHLISLQQAKEKPNLKEDKRQQLEAQIEQGQTNLKNKTDKLESSEASFKNDLERFDLERKIDFSCMLQSFLNLQIEYNQKLHECWSDRIPQVNASIYEE